MIAGISPALSQMSPFAPNGIQFVDNADTFAINVPNNITVQLLYEGGPLRSEGVRVYFLSNDDSLITAPMGTYVLTDKDGRATLNFTANKTGDVSITVTPMSPGSGHSASKKFHLMGSLYSISGLVVDSSNNPIANAGVTLYASNNGEKGSMVQIDNNPQKTSSSGSYRFGNVPPGSYYIEAKMDTKSGFVTDNLTTADQTVVVTIPGNVPVSTVAATPKPSSNVTMTPVPSAEPTPTMAPTTAPTVVPSASANGDAQATGIVVTGIIVAIILVIGIYVFRMNRKK